MPVTQVFLDFLLLHSSPLIMKRTSFLGVNSRRFCRSLYNHSTSASSALLVGAWIPVILNGLPWKLTEIILLFLRLGGRLHLGLFRPAQNCKPHLPITFPHAHSPHACLSIPLHVYTSRLGGAGLRLGLPFLLRYLVDNPHFAAHLGIPVLWLPMWQAPGPGSFL